MTQPANQSPVWLWGPIRGEDLWHMSDNDFRNVKWQFWSLSGLMLGSDRPADGDGGYLRVPDASLITLSAHSLHNNQHQAEADTRPRVLKAHSSDINLDNVNMLLRSAFFTSLWFLWTALIVSPGQARSVLTGSAISNPPVLVMTRHPRPLVILTSSIVRLSSVSPVSHSTPRSPATAITKTRGSPTINWR